MTQIEYRTRAFLAENDPARRVYEGVGGTAETFVLYSMPLAT